MSVLVTSDTGLSNFLSKCYVRVYPRKNAHNAYKAPKGLHRHNGHAQIADHAEVAIELEPMVRGTFCQNNSVEFS